MANYLVFTRLDPSMLLVCYDVITKKAMTHVSGPAGPAPTAGCVGVCAAQDE